MNIRYLQTFVSIVDSGSIARASGRLNVSQPAASRQILALEAELGVPLFDRIGRRLRLTSQGEDLLQLSRRLLMDADVLSARARALKGGHTGILRIGATPMVIEHMLSAFLGKYQVRHSGVEVHFVEDGGLRLPSRLEHSDIHLALIVPDDRFASKLLFPSHNLAVLSSKHPLSRRRMLEVEELANEPLLLLHRTFGSRHWLDSAFTIAQLRARVLLESAAPHTLMALAQIDYGIAVVPSTVLVPRRLRAVPLVQRKTSIGRWVTIAWNPRQSLSAYAEQFVDELVAYCRHDYPGRRAIQRAPPLPRPES
jgi:LysR family transcriptional regulator, cyn operon transcriptional activator